MKKKLIIISLALATLFSVGYKNQAEAHTTVSFSLFFNALAPYGNWISTPDYGYVWSPTDIGPDWRPYTYGHWVWTDYGWTWASYEPWGWAPYHYGRWAFLDYYGWVWIPGTVWAPAWVTWYTSPGYIGWAPLSPDNDFFLGIGINIGFNSYNYYIPPSQCAFVSSSYFLNTNIRSVIIPRSQNARIIGNTTKINNIRVVNNRVINNGPDVRFVERNTGVKVQRVNVAERDVGTRAVVKGGANINKLDGKNFYVFRPDVVKKANETPLPKKEPTKSTLKIRNRDESFSGQNNLHNPPNREYPIFKKESTKNAVEIKNGKEVIHPNNKKVIKKDEKLPNQDSLENPPDSEYPMQWSNKKGNSFVGEENTARSQNPDIYSENRYPAHKNTGRQFLKGSTRSMGNLKQTQEVNTNSYTQMNQKRYYETKPNTREKKFQKTGLKQHSSSSERDLDSDTYQNQWQTPIYQNNSRKEPRPSRHFGN